MASRLLIIDTDSDLYPIVLARDLCQIHDTSRLIFMTLVGLLCLCVLVGNISSLYVNTRRKLRPFFRACLISLACSDIMYCINFTTSNMAVFNAEYLEVWVLGSFMCNWVPFINTTTVLCSSFMLVAVALDRYMAIRRAAVGIWNPSLTFCTFCIGTIWLACVCTASPLFFIYRTMQVYIQETDELVVDELQEVTMCVGLRTQVGVYNSVSLSLVFVPCIVAFILLNLTIARQLWQRRHQQRSMRQRQSQIQKQRQRQQQLQLEQPKPKEKPLFVHLLSTPETTYAMMTAFSVAASFDMSTAQLSAAGAQLPPELPPKLSPAAAARVDRHRRMVHVVLLMMGVFICLRLPAWVFLLMRVYGSFSTPVSWMFYFSFGLLNLTSCALNPLFYTFLAPTIRVLSRIKRLFLLVFCCRRPEKPDSDATMPKETTKQGLCCGLQVTWRCHLRPPSPATEATGVAVVELPTADASSVPPLGDSKDDFKDFAIYNENSLQSTASIESSA